MPQIIDPTAAALRLIIERMHKHVGDRVYDLRLEAESLLPLASLSAFEPAETTYTITAANPAHAAASGLGETETRTLASARDLARDLGIPLILRDERGYIRAHVDADGGYRLT